LTKALREIGAVVDHAADGREGLLLAAGNDYDVLVVDRMLPSLDGLSIVRTLRASGNKTPVLILSALGEVDDRVEGLRAGGDDYLVKPFAFSELHARIEALLRRAVPGRQPRRRGFKVSPTWRWTC
jgi:two-component system OmpR family response regulator